MVVYEGEVIQRYSPKTKETQWGVSRKYYMEIKLDDSTVKKCMVELPLGSSEYDALSPEEKAEVDLRNSIKIGDRVKVSCRLNKRSPEWCGVTLKQNLEIISKSTIPKRKLRGLVTKRYSPKCYENRQANRFFMEVDSGTEIFKVMVLTNEEPSGHSEYADYYDPYSECRTNYKYNDDRDSVAVHDWILLEFDDPGPNSEWIEINEEDTIKITKQGTLEREKEEKKKQREWEKKKEKERADVRAKEKHILDTWKNLADDPKPPSVFTISKTVKFLKYFRNKWEKAEGGIKLTGIGPKSLTYAMSPSQVKGIWNRLIKTQMIMVNEDKGGVYYNTYDLTEKADEFLAEWNLEITKEDIEYMDEREAFVRSKALQFV